MKFPEKLWKNQNKEKTSEIKHHNSIQETLEFRIHRPYQPTYNQNQDVKKDVIYRVPSDYEYEMKEVVF